MNMIAEHTAFDERRDADVTPTEQAYAELQLAYDHYNRTLFDGQLPGCLLTFQRAKKTMGYFSPARWVNLTKLKCDEIALNPEYFATSTLMEILQTLCHECCHQWQLHYGKPSRQCYHNREWATKMEEIGLMPSDTGLPGGKMVGQAVRDYCLPGGRFEQATVALLQRGFLLSWKDRYPAQVDGPGHGHVIDELVTAGVIPSGILAPAEAPATAPDYRDALMSAYSVPTPGDELVLDRKKPRGQRATYQCQTCETRVWGKSGLKLVCGVCHEAYHELPPREAPTED